MCYIGDMEKRTIVVTTEYLPWWSWVLIYRPMRPVDPVALLVGVGLFTIQVVFVVVSLISG
jgi:hypothetical protein